MSGWPIRSSRASFGASKIDRAAQINPRASASAHEWNRLVWLATGLGVAAPLAWVLLHGSDGALLASGEAWNPDGDYALRPTCERSSTGIYQVTYAASYPDMDGVSTPIAINCGIASPQSGTAGIVATVGRAGNTMIMRVVAAATNVAADADVLLQVY